MVDPDVNIGVDWSAMLKAFNKMSDKLDDVLTKFASETTAKSAAYLDKWQKTKREMLQLDDKLKKERRMVEVATRSAGMFGSGGAIGGLTNIATSYAYMRRGQTERLRELQKQKKLTKDEKSELSVLQTQKAGTSPFDKFFDRFDKTFGAGSKWDEMFKGHGKMMAGAIGGLGVTGGLALGKAIIDSSPAFQQLLKLMNFGFMLILRPIGDFFAFIFRPILILLLRKFIIPFYQHVYPFFAKYGRKIGDLLSGEGGLGKLIGESIKINMADFSSVLDQYFPRLKKAEPTTDEKKDKKLEEEGKKTKIDEKQKKLDDFTKTVEKKTNLTDNALKDALKTTTKGASTLKTAGSAIKTGSTLGKIGKGAITAAKVVDRAAGLPAEIPIKAAKGIYKGTKAATKAVAPPILQKAAEKTASAGKNVAMKLGGKQVAKTATKIAATQAAKTATKVVPIIGQVLTAIDIAGSALKAANPEAYNQIREGARSALEPYIGHDAFEIGSDFLGWGEQSTAEQIYDMGKTVGGWFGGANGALIKEPIIGKGLSGKKYKFGEMGRKEMILPMGGSALATKPKGFNSGSTSPLDFLGWNNKKADSGGLEKAPIVINVTVNGNIMSDKDMTAFQKTIMKAIEASNVRRAKL